MGTFDFGDYYEFNESIHGNYTVNDLNLNTAPCDIQVLSPAVTMALCIILVIIFLTAIPGNLLVGWVIGTNRNTRTPSDVYLIHLTIADGLMALTVPFWAVALKQGWVFGDFMCKFLNLVFETNFYTSILFLACISIDRYLVIVHASEVFKSRQRTCSRLLCASIWALGWALALPALFNDAHFSPDTQRMICSENFDIGNASSWRLATRVFRHIFGFLLPLLVMVVCYSVTIVRLLRTRGFQKHRAMKVIIAVVIAFLLCWTPYHITMILDMLIREGLVAYDCAMRRAVNVALPTTSSLALLHSCINPVLYAFIAEKFRRRMVLLFQRRARQERISGSKFSRSTSQTSEGSGAVL